MELRDKLDGLPVSAGGGPVVSGVPLSTDPASEASHALASLGYKPAEVSRMVRAVAEAGMDAEEIIRKALQTRVKPNG
jgi:Holliday junction DNA helicase RuvA